jgi:hypothetical protein
MLHNFDLFFTITKIFNIDSRFNVILLPKTALQFKSFSQEGNKFFIELFSVLTNFFEARIDHLAAKTVEKKSNPVFCIHTYLHTHASVNGNMSFIGAGSINGALLQCMYNSNLPKVKILKKKIKFRLHRTPPETLRCSYLVAPSSLWLLDIWPVGQIRSRVI